MRRPASPSTATPASRCESLSQNGQSVRWYCQRVPQQPQASSRLAAGVRADQLRHGRQRAAGRAVAAKPALLVPPARRTPPRPGARYRASTVQPRYRSRPGDAGANESSPSSQSTTRRAASASPRRSGVQGRGFRRQAAGQRLARRASRRARRPSSPRARGPVPRRSSAGAARPRENRRRSRPNRERPRRRSRDRPPRDRPARRGPRPAGGRHALPASRPRVKELNGASLGSGLGRTGMSRAPRPNRKIVAAIRPTEMPHSKIDGA